MKGIRKDSFIVSVLLVASKQAQGGRTLKSFSRTTGIEEKDIKRFYKQLIRDPSIINPSGLRPRKSTEEEVKELIELFCNKLQQPYIITKEAKEVASKAISSLEGKRPSSVAAAAIQFVFAAHNIPQKQQDLANIANISTNTLRNVYRELNNCITNLPPHLLLLRSNVQLAC